MNIIRVNNKHRWDNNINKADLYISTVTDIENVKIVKRDIATTTVTYS